MTNAGLVCTFRFDGTAPTARPSVSCSPTTLPLAMHNTPIIGRALLELADLSKTAARNRVVIEERANWTNSAELFTAYESLCPGR
jgi:hypothetical protein